MEEEIHYIDLTKELMGKMKSYPRKRGRYNSSELYAIFAGWVTPETWLNPKERTIEEVKRMWKGIGGHEQIQFMLNNDICEKKKVVNYKDITLVGKADVLPDKKLKNGAFVDEVWELKTSEKVFDKAKPWHTLQAKLYCTMFERSKGVLLQPVETETQVLLKKIGEVERDDEWFKKQLNKLYEFHLKVEELWEKQ